LTAQRRPKKSPKLLLVTAATNQNITALTALTKARKIMDGHGRRSPTREWSHHVNLRTIKEKVVTATKEDVISSHNNSFRGRIGDAAETFTLDTWAEITIVPKEMVPKEL